MVKKNCRKVQPPE